MKALVVDSSQTMRSVLRRILSMRTFDVTEAEHGPEALDLLRGIGEVDLVLVDWNLHSTDSLDLVTRLRTELAYDTKVILLAATEPGKRQLQRAVIAGADGYLIKPFTSLQMDEELSLAGCAWRS